MIDTVLLDAGGVLLDESEHEMLRAIIAVQVLSKRVPEYGLLDYWADIREAVQGHVPTVYRYVIWKHSGRDMAVFDSLQAEYSEIWQAQKPKLHLMGHMHRVIRELAADFYLLIAGQYGKELLELLEIHHLLRFFGAALTQDDFDITKPDPRYYEQILQRAGREANRSVMVGDRIDKDVVPAKAIGMRTIRVKVGIHAEQEPRIPDEIADMEITNVSEIPDAVRGLAGASPDPPTGN